MSTFGTIFRYFRHIHHELERSGAGPYRFTKLGAWATSRPSHVHYFFRSIDLRRFRLFLDLGSGDGIVTCLAGLHTRAIGIEVDPELCRVAGRAARDLALREKASFICGDYLTQNILCADCLYLYPDKPFYRVEQILLESDWNGTLLVYGPHLPPQRLLPVRNLKCGKEQFTSYRKRR